LSDGKIFNSLVIDTIDYVAADSTGLTSTRTVTIGLWLLSLSTSTVTTSPLQWADVPINRKRDSYPTFR